MKAAIARDTPNFLFPRAIRTRMYRNVYIVKNGAVFSFSSDLFVGRNVSDEAVFISLLIFSLKS